MEYIDKLISDNHLQESLIECDNHNFINFRELLE